MENTKENPQMNLGRVIELRQDDLVAIPLERFQELLESEIRLDILVQMRRREIASETYTYTRPEDHVLGPEIETALWIQEEAHKKAMEDADE